MKLGSILITCPFSLFSVCPFEKLTPLMKSQLIVQPRAWASNPETGCLWCIKYLNPQWAGDSANGHKVKGTLQLNPMNATQTKSHHRLAFALLQVGTPEHALGDSLY